MGDGEEPVFDHSITGTSDEDEKIDGTNGRNPDTGCNEIIINGSCCKEQEEGIEDDFCLVLNTFRCRPFPPSM